jgi:hypothetical protein
MSALSPKRKAPKEGKALRIVEWQSYRVCELETGSMEVYENDSLVTPAKPALRQIATELGLAIVNGNGNPYNTRQLGTCRRPEKIAAACRQGCDRAAGAQPCRPW